MNNNVLRVSALVFMVVVLTISVYYIVEELQDRNKKTTQYNAEQQQKGLEKASKNENSNYDYYNNLRKKCKTKDGYNCCLASVDILERLNVKSFGDGKCKDGSRKNTLLCIDSYSWCEKDKFSKNKDGDNVDNVSNKTVSISELINSKVSEGTHVKVSGAKGPCVELKVTSGYEGLPSGCRLYDKNNKIKVIAISLEAYLLAIPENSEVIVEGEVMYCGGKKRDKYICYLKNAKILNN